MKKARKFAAFLLVIFMLCSGSALAVNAEYTLGDYKYSIYDEGALIIEYIGSDAVVSVPGTMPNPDGGSVDVFAIGDEAFLGNSVITSVTLPNSVTAIGQEAFSGCKKLASFAFGSEIQKIGISAFNFCTSLKHATIPDSVTELLNGAFQYCSALETVTLGSGITSVADGVFRGCSKLTSATLGTGIESVGMLAFSSCTVLDTVNIYDRTTSIAADAFDSNFAGIIYGYPDSYAKTFAAGKNFDFQAYNFNAIEITAKPTKLSYFVGEQLDESGLKVSALYTDAPKRDVTAKCIVSDEQFTGIGSKSITVSYSESGYARMQAFNVEIIENAVESLEWVREPAKKTYYEGYQGAVDLSEIELSATYTDGTMKTIYLADGITVSALDTSSTGVKTLTVKFYGKSLQYSVTVIADTVESIELVSKPSKIAYSYKYSGNVDLSGTVINVKYASGKSERITDTSKMSVSGFNARQKGEQTLTLLFEGKTTQFKVTVQYEWWQWLIKILLFGWIWY